MFPLSLKKNILELDRQISLLETECEHLESDKKEATSSSKGNMKSMPNKPFVTGPCASASAYSSKMLVLSSGVPEIYSSSCAHFRTMTEKHQEVKSPDYVANKCGRSVKFLKKSDKFTEFHDDFDDENIDANCDESSENQQKPKSKENKKPFKRSINSIREESSDENRYMRNSSCSKPPKNSLKTSEDNNNNNNNNQVFKEPILTEELQNKNKKCILMSDTKPKISAEEERKKVQQSEEVEGKSFNEKWPNDYDESLNPRRRMLSKRRPRSARTKKNHSNDIVLDVNMTKVLQEKEIQCVLGNEENEKAEIFTNLCDSLRTLCVLTGEAQSKSSREKINDVLNDMKNNLIRISKINVKTQEENPINLLASIKGNHIKPLEGHELNHLKKSLYGVTKFCQELAGEKSALTEELLVKNRALANSKTKEKEYLSMISNLKFNLKKMRQEAEDKAFVMRDLEILKTKLQEETKVIEALRKSHEKMQELVENYVLENDKLKAKVKINKLESEKFHILLAGKEEEIKKYKKDIESFQRQITEQLSLLRSKATENEVVDALKAISDQTNSLHTEIESSLSTTTVEKGTFKTIVLKSFETTSLSSIESKKKKLTSPERFKKEDNCKKSSSSREFSKEEKTLKEKASCLTYKASETDSDTNLDTQQGLKRVLSGSKNLRSSINELLEDIRRETSDHWSNMPCESTSLSTLSTSSDGQSTKSDRGKKLK